jgi:hypothetical protein
MPELLFPDRDGRTNAINSGTGTLSIPWPQVAERVGPVLFVVSEPPVTVRKTSVFSVDTRQA